MSEVCKECGRWSSGHAPDCSDHPLNKDANGSSAASCSRKKFWEGKNVIIIWTDKAADDGADWISFRVVKEVPDGLFLQGCGSVEGVPHDGSHHFARNEEIRDIFEWKVNPPANSLIRDP